MAHIPDGVLSAPVLIAGAVVGAGLLGFALRRIGEDDLPKAALATAAFFVASLVSLPVGAASVHLLLAGLMGLVIGWATVPAVFVGLLLQSVLFGFGGLTTLGVNTVNIALPGLFWAAAARPLLGEAPAGRRVAVVAALVAGLSVASTGGLVALALMLSDEAYRASARIVAATYLPLLLVESAVTAAAAGFLARVRPGTLGRPRNA